MPRYPSWKKPVYKKKRVAKKRYTKRLPLLKSPYGLNIPYAYKRMGKSLVIQNSTTASTITTNDSSQINLSTVQADTVGSMFGASMQFRLGNIQTPGDFQALYDQYRIRGVRVTIIPLSDSSTAQSSGFLPTLYWARDNDNAGTVPSAENILRERQDVKVMRLTGPRSIYIRNPKQVIDTTVQGGVTLNSLNATGWVDCNDQNVMHNGLVMWFKNVDLRAQPGTTTAFRFECTYYLEFRNPQ